MSQLSIKFGDGFETGSTDARPGGGAGAGLTGTFRAKCKKNSIKKIF